MLNETERTFLKTNPNILALFERLLRDMKITELDETNIAVIKAAITYINKNPARVEGLARRQMLKF